MLVGYNMPLFVFFKPKSLNNSLMSKIAIVGVGDTRQEKMSNLVIIFRFIDFDP